MIKVDVRFDLKLDISLQKNTYDEITSKVPSMAMYRYSNTNYEGQIEFTETFVFDSMADFMIKFDKTVTEYIEGNDCTTSYLYEKFGRDIYMDNRIGLKKVNFKILEMKGMLDGYVY